MWGLQVTDAEQQTVELRALMSAADASQAWDLRCHVREKLIEFSDCVACRRSLIMGGGTGRQ